MPSIGNDLLSYLCQMCNVLSIYCSHFSAKISEWAYLTHVKVALNRVIIGSINGLMPAGCQAIT